MPKHLDRYKWNHTRIFRKDHKNTAPKLLLRLMTSSQKPSFQKLLTTPAQIQFHKREIVRKSIFSKTNVAKCSGIGVKKSTE